MYTEPNTDIFLLNAVPLDNNYINTVLFNSYAEQYNYFHSRRSKSLDKYSYQRVNKNTIRVGVNYHDLLVCNYLMFKNSSHENKWYYAFITDYEYINEVTSTITYEIDVMQTYMFDYNLNECLIERQHLPTDELFANTIPENLDIGEVMQAVDYKLVDLNDMWVAVIVSKTEDDNYVPAGFVNNVYTATATYTGYSVTNVDSLNSLIKTYVDNGREDEIIAIYQYPRNFSSAELHTERVNFDITNFTTLNGHTVRNKKLFTYPYTYLMANNYCGDTAIYKFEDWNSPEYVGHFDLWGTFISLPEARLIPRYYRNLQYDMDSSLVLRNFPECAWIGDAYAVWYAQNKSQIATGLATTAVNEVFGGVRDVVSASNSFGSRGESSMTNMAMGLAQHAINIGTKAANTLAKMSDMERVPPQVHGQTSASTFNAGAGLVGYGLYQFSVKREYLEIIDDYFDRYGYAFHRHSVPNRNARPHWTYVKTAGCTINGTLPHFAEEKIMQIYDNGITFWNHADEVGDYALDNSPVTT